MEFFKPPGEMSFSTGNVAETWKRWRSKFENYLLATEKSGKDERTKIAICLNLLGDEAVDIYNTFKLAETGLKLDDVLQKFEDYSVPRKNVVFERFKFFSCNQQEGQGVDAYVTQLKTLAAACEFDNQEETLIRDRVVLGLRDSALQERLLREPQLSLKKALEFVRATEVSREQSKTIQEPSSSAVNVVKKKTFSKHDPKPPQNEYNCNKCGRVHKKRECPAYNKLCNNCKQKNHFALMCKNKRKNLQVNMKKGSKLVNAIQNEESVQNIPSIYIDTVNINNNTEKEWTKTILVTGKPIEFKLDTGAEANILPLSICSKLKLYNNDQLIKTDVVLISYGNHKLKPEGQVSLTCSTDKCKNISLQFEIVDVESRPILGLNACVKLGLIKRIDQIRFQTKEQILTSYEEVFKGLGCFPGEPYKITLKEEVTPVINPPRRVPQALHELLKQTLTALESQGIITQVNKPTDWVSSLVVVEKPNGKLRICLDPRNLNKAIKREHHIIPSSEEIISRLEGKEYFSVLDLKEGFWQVPLDSQSSDLCTFHTPFGRYKFNRIPFGIISAPEVFQKRNQKMFGDIKGVEIYFDDLIVAGVDKNDHDKILHQVLERARENNIKFNPDKFQFGVQEVKYMGLIISKDGIKADKSHVRAINELETPTNKSDIRRLLGMVNFLSKFLPNISKLTAPLRELLKNSVEFQWSWEQEKAFSDIKKLISSAPALKVFNSAKEIVIQCDSSKDGLGVCLMQEGHPVSYASRSLTESEQNYAQIEKELLAIVFAFEKYHNLVYGHKVLIESDHKPLLAIVQKPINKISFRLQKMVLKLLKYDFKIKYLPGTQMYLADTLSRAYIKDKVLDDPEMLSTVHSISRYLPMSEQRVDQFRNAILKDEELNYIVKYCKEGWPEAKEIPSKLKNYAKLQNDLLLIDGLLFLNDKIVIPKTLRPEMLLLIHESHLGIEKCKSRAREVMYWPGINHDIETLVSKCSVCEKFRKSQCKEPLIPHEIPGRPFQKIGIDIMFFRNCDYLVLIDYYSKWIESVSIQNKTAIEIIAKLEDIFSRFGIPETIVCDNNPFNSCEFRKFGKGWDIEINFTSPRYAQSNGMIEKAVGIVKSIFKKAHEDNKRPTIALLEYRNTPIAGIGLSPAQLLLNRRVRTKLPITNRMLNPEIFNENEIKEKLTERQQKQKFYFDKSVKELEPLRPGDNICVRNFKLKTWEPAVVVSRNKNSRSYNIRTTSGRILTRNRKHLLKSNVEGNRLTNLESTYFMQEPLSENEEPNETESRDHTSPQSVNSPSFRNNTFQTRYGRVSRRPFYLNNYVT